VFEGGCFSWHLFSLHLQHMKQQAVFVTPDAMHAVIHGLKRGATGVRLSLQPQHAASL
jgi:hypothetical protein